MEKQAWHTSFNPKEFLSKIDLDKLIEKMKYIMKVKLKRGVSPVLSVVAKKVRAFFLMINHIFVRPVSQKLPQYHIQLNTRMLGEII